MPIWGREGIAHGDAFYDKSINFFKETFYVEKHLTFNWNIWKIRWKNLRNSFSFKKVYNKFF